MMDNLDDLAITDEQDLGFNLLEDFNRAVPYETYLEELGGYFSLHQLHYKKFVPDNEMISRIEACKPLNVLVLTESWCADSLALLPVLQKIAEYNGTWHIKILYRNANPELMNQFLTHGVKAIPVFLFLDKQGQFLFRWGPRPESTAGIFDSYRQQLKDGKIEKQEVIKKIRAFYAKDRGVSTSKELMTLFQKNVLC